MQKTSQEKPSNNSKKKPTNNYMQYAGMAFQMAILLAAGAFIGRKLDGYYETERPYFTALLLIVFLFAAFYLVLKDLIGGKKN